MEWSNETVLEFLEHYELEALIWNAAHPFHKNRNMVHDAWKRIEEKMDQKFTVSDLKKKKDSLMASFRTCLKRVKDSMKSGASADDVFKPNWFAFPKMSAFLRDKDAPRETVNSEVILLTFIQF